MSGKPPVTVLIVDDHELVRVGLRSVLSRTDDIRVVGEAGSGEEALARIAELKPQVVLLDLRLPGMSGLETCRRIKQEHPQVAVVILTSFADDEEIMGAVRAGASGYLLKQIGSSQLVEAVRAVAAGNSFLAPEVTTRLLAHLREGMAGAPAGESQLLSELTPHERRILQLIASGLTNREIAARLRLSEKTVRNYVSSILNKLGLNNRAEAAAFAVRHRLAGE
ncbi:MAG: response regulator transcription factor [Limnochordales bacterium]|nr:response regulator transcription factor [Limnochordales bacterium]